MNEEQKKILENFTNLEAELEESNFLNDFKILRKAWNIEIQKPGCTQCIKNGAKNKYTQIATNMILHNFSIEEAKQVNDKRTELNKKHAEVAREIENEIQATIKNMKNKDKDPESALLESLTGEAVNTIDAPGKPAVEVSQDDSSPNPFAS